SLSLFFLCCDSRLPLHSFPTRRSSDLDEHWYEKGIFAWNFEVGADLWDAEAGRWRAVGFQPPFEEGYEEAMEFSNGMIGMLEVRSEEHTSELQSRFDLVCRLLLEKKKR